MASNQTEEPIAHIKSRFSTRRFENAVKNLTFNQWKILTKYGYDRLLDLKVHIAYPLHLIEWIVENFIPELALFKYGTKEIKFNKSMVLQFLGGPSGDIPVSLSSDDPATVEKVNILRKKYMVDGKLFTKRAIELMAGDENEESFIFPFILVYVATIGCPCTSDTIDWNILFSLADVTTINRFDWPSFFLQRMFREIEKCQKKIAKANLKNPVYVGGCVPVLAVSISDFSCLFFPLCLCVFCIKWIHGFFLLLDLNSLGKQHQIVYGVPRIYHVRAADFQHVIQLDSDASLSGNMFGVLNLREISCTPYSESAIKEAIDKEKERHQLALLAIGYGSSGPHTSQQQVNSDQVHNAPNDDENSTPEIKTIIETIIQSHKAELFRDVHKMVDMMVNSQFCLMSEAINSAISQHFVSCEANIANRSKSRQDSVECDGGKGEVTPGVHSDAIPHDRDSFQSLQQLDHAVGEAIGDEIPVMSVPSSSCPTDGRSTEHVDASAVAFHASTSFENTLSPDQASNVHKLASTNNREGDLLMNVSNKGLVVNLHAVSLQDGDPALITEKQNQDEVSVHSLVPNESMSDLTPGIPSTTLLGSCVPQVINSMEAPTTVVDLSTSGPKDPLEQASIAVNPQVINSMEAPATGVDLSTSIPKDPLEQASNAVNPQVINSMEAPASGVDLSTSGPKDHLEQASNAVSHSPEDMEVDTVSLGIEMAMSYADESFTGTESNEPSPSDCKGAASSVIEISGPSTINKKKQKKRSMKKPCASEDLFKLVVSESVELFYKKYLGNRIIKTKEIAKSIIVLDINGYLVNYEDFYRSLKA